MPRPGAARYVLFPWRPASSSGVGPPFSGRRGAPLGKKKPSTHHPPFPQKQPPLSPACCQRRGEGPAGAAGGVCERGGARWGGRRAADRSCLIYSPPGRVYSPLPTPLPPPPRIFLPPAGPLCVASAGRAGVSVETAELRQPCPAAPPRLPSIRRRARGAAGRAGPGRAVTAAPSTFGLPPLAAAEREGRVGRLLWKRASAIACSLSLPRRRLSIARGRNVPPPQPGGKVGGGRRGRASRQSPVAVAVFSVVPRSP